MVKSELAKACPDELFGVPSFLLDLREERFLDGGGILVLDWEVEQTVVTSFRSLVWALPDFAAVEKAL